MKKAIRVDKALSWKATELYQVVLDNPEFSTLSLPKKLRVYDRLTWLYWVQKKYERAEIPARQAVKLREIGFPHNSVKEDDRDYVSNESSWYTQSLEWLAKTQLKLGQFHDAQEASQKAYDAYGKFNKYPSTGQKWEIIVNWARSFALDGNSPAAIPLYELAFEIKSLDGKGEMDGHYGGARAFGELANLYRDRNDFARAEELYTKGISIMTKPVYAKTGIFDWDEVKIANFLGYAKLMRMQGRNGEAETLEAKAATLKALYK